MFLFLFATIVQAQERMITGTVTAQEDGSPIPGVSVLVRGTTQGTITDFDGNYSLKVEGDKVLVFSFIGMEMQEIDATGKTKIDVVMENATLDVEEVVVVGYGVQKKSVVTGAVAKVGGEQFENMQTPRIEDAMQGRTAGVIVTANSGQPGEASTVRIRGVGTTNNSEPLYIVDGVPIGGGIDFLDPSDIESIEVLKDAASSAIYGARAANGVILVTTKTGKKGASVISYNAYYGIQNPWKKRAMLNASEYAMIMNESYANAGKAAPYESPASFGEGTDWQDEVFSEDAPIQSHNVSLSGATDRMSYYSSFGYFNQEGIVGGDKSKYERYSIKLNTDYLAIDEDRKFFKKLNIGINSTYTNIKSRGIDTNSEWGSPLGSALMLSPIETVYQDDEAVLAGYPENYVTDENGRAYNIIGSQEITNPLADLAIRNSENWSHKIVSNFYANLVVVDKVTFRSSYGVDLAFWGDRGYTPLHYIGVTKKADVNSVWSGKNNGYTWNFENTVNYNNSFGLHNLDVIVGQSSQKTFGESLWGKSYNLPQENWDKAWIDYSTATNEDREATGGVWEHTLASYFGRINYNYDEKYILQAVIRMDGSSNFGPTNKWGYFPSVSAGWVLTREDFMTDTRNWLDFLKVRAGWGQNGNENMDAFMYTSTLAGGYNYTMGTGTGETIVNGVKPTSLVNPNVKWETSEQLNFGVDARMFDGKLSFTADYFIKKTKDMLAIRDVNAFYGNGSPWDNVGTMENKGVELELSYKTKFGPVKFSATANATYLTNEVTEIGNDEGILWHTRHAVGDFITRSENGKPYSYIYGYKTDGIFQNDAEVAEYVAATGLGGAPTPVPGDVRFVDYNNDGVLDSDDRTMIGNPTPDWLYGLTLNADWNGFDATIFFQGVFGNDIYDATRRPELTTMNYPASILDRWTGEGTSNSIPRVTVDDSNRNTRVSDLYVYNGSYLRIKDAQIGYTLPSVITKKAGISKLRVYVSAHNLLTITDYPGFDPEIGAGGLGVDKGIYPQARTYSVGVNMNF